MATNCRYQVKHERQSITTFPNTEKRVEARSAAEFFFHELQGVVGRCVQTRSQAFDISSQWKLKPNRTRRKVGSQQRKSMLFKVSAYPKIDSFAKF